jgi:hypothetical protein
MKRRLREDLDGDLPKLTYYILYQFVLHEGNLGMQKFRLSPYKRRSTDTSKGD